MDAWMHANPNGINQTDGIFNRYGIITIQIDLLQFDMLAGNFDRIFSSSRRRHMST